MTQSRAPARARRGFLALFRDRGATSAVEFALVSSPLIVLMLGLMQMGIYFMTQSSLDSGVSRTAETLRNNFTTGTTPTLLNAAALKTAVVANAGGLLNNDSTAGVEIRQLVSIDSAVVPIVDGTVDYGSTTSVLVLRAQAQVMIFVPGLAGLAKVQSSAIIRRQGT